VVDLNAAKPRRVWLWTTQNQFTVTAETPAATQVLHLPAQSRADEALLRTHQQDHLSISHGALCCNSRLCTEFHIFGEASGALRAGANGTSSGILADKNVGICSQWLNPEH
jgi:hypothetical protein